MWKLKLKKRFAKHDVKNRREKMLTWKYWAQRFGFFGVAAPAASSWERWSFHCLKHVLLMSWKRENSCSKLLNCWSSKETWTFRRNMVAHVLRLDRLLFQMCGCGSSALVWLHAEPLRQHHHAQRALFILSSAVANKSHTTPAVQMSVCHLFPSPQVPPSVCPSVRPQLWSQTSSFWEPGHSLHQNKTKQK